MSFVKFLGKVLCPPSCVICKDVFSFNDDYALCPECAEVMSVELFDAMADVSHEYIDNAYYCFEYNTWHSKKLIRHTKYVSSESFLRYIGKLGRNSLAKHNLLNQIDVITFVPRRKSQINMYGFDQSQEMANAISTTTGIPCEKLLSRVGFAFEQKKLNKLMRINNVKGKYACDADVDGLKVLLIDDVITTGSTVSECAKMLKNRGAKAVYVWAIAQ